ncbi:MAG: hypothetical protein ACFE7S_08620 [Candidatus Hodarchaeota archaeon]
MNKARIIASALFLICTLSILVHPSFHAVAQNQSLATGISFSWTAPSNISESNMIGFTAEVDRGLCVDSQENVHIVYHGSTNAFNSNTFEIFYANNANGSWNTPYRLTTNDVADIHSTIAADHQGNIHIAYRGSDSNDLEIMYINKTLSGWSIPENISKDDYDDGVVSIAVDNNGYVHIAWQGNDGEDNEIYYSNNLGGFWSPPVNLTQNEQNEDYPSIIVDPQNVVHVVWEGHDGSPNRDMEIFYTNSIGGSWAIQNVTENELDNIKPSIGLDNESNVHLSYMERNTSSYEFGVFYVARNNGIWGTPVRISAITGIALHTSLAVDGEGGIHVAYSQVDLEGYVSFPADYEIFYTSNAAGFWGTPINITQNDLGDYRPCIFVDGLNYAHIVYHVLPTAYFPLDPNIIYIKSTDPVVVLGGGGTHVLLLIGVSFAGVAAAAAVALWLLRKREVPFP